MRPPGSIFPQSRKHSRTYSSTYSRTYSRTPGEITEQARGAAAPRVPRATPGRPVTCGQTEPNCGPNLPTRLT